MAFVGWEGLCVPENLVITKCMARRFDAALITPFPRGGCLIERVMVHFKTKPRACVRVCV